MPLRVHVHAAIWMDGKLAVHRHHHHGRDHVTLPGGRVKDREALLDALRREVREEIGREIDIDDLLFAGEVNRTSRQDVVLIFGARLHSPSDLGELEFVDPEGSEAEAVLPPVLDRLASVRREQPLWLGNLYKAQGA